MGNVAAMSQLLQKSERFDSIIHNAGITKALSPEAYREGDTETPTIYTGIAKRRVAAGADFLFVSSLAALGAAHYRETQNSCTPKAKSPHPLQQSRWGQIMLAAIPLTSIGSGTNQRLFMGLGGRNIRRL